MRENDRGLPALAGRQSRGARRRRSWASPGWPATARRSWKRRSPGCAGRPPASIHHLRTGHAGQRHRAAALPASRTFPRIATAWACSRTSPSPRTWCCSASASRRSRAAAGWTATRSPRNARDSVADYDVRTPSVETLAGNLSGGNAQKMVLARELARKPEGAAGGSADTRPGCERDRVRPSQADRAARCGAGGASDFHRAGRDPRAQRPDRRHVRGPDRGRGATAAGVDVNEIGLMMAGAARHQRGAANQLAPASDGGARRRRMTVVNLEQAPARACSAASGWMITSARPLAGVVAGLLHRRAADSPRRRRTRSRPTPS